MLGDAVEWGQLDLTLADGTQRRFTLPETLVFEDTAPRLADLDGDGAPEVIAVESAQTGGARLAVWGPQGRLAATPHIGQRNRWLAPVGAADLDADGIVEIAYVDRPHLARLLRVWQYRDGGMHEIAQHAGVTNHRIGWPDIPGGIRTCNGHVEMILADGGWRDILALRFDGRTFARRVLAPYDGKTSLDRALTCPRD